MITKEFDTNSPDDIAIHIDGLSKATQSIAMHNSLIIQHGRERSGTTENLLKKSFGLGLSRPLPMSASLVYAMTAGAHASKQPQPSNRTDGTEDKGTEENDSSAPAQSPYEEVPLNVPPRKRPENRISKPLMPFPSKDVIKEMEDEDDNDENEDKDAEMKGKIDDYF